MSQDTRFVQLRQFVSRITSESTREETRYIKFLLSDFHTDLIGELPVELVIIIAMQLTLEDFATCLCVSKVWRDKFLSSSVMNSFAQRFWPALTHGEVLTRQDFLGTLTRVGWASYSNRNWDHIDIEEVPYGCIRPTNLDSEVHPMPGRNPAYMHIRSDAPSIWGTEENFYCSGKVAWNAKGVAGATGHVIVVDDLRLHTRKVLTPPSGVMNGVRLIFRAFGSKLAVATIARMLIAWDHIDNRALEKLLPCHAHRCTTRDDKVAVVLSGGGVLIWKFGHAMVQLDTSSLILELSLNHREAERWKACITVFFDSRDSNTLYLASVHPRSVDSKDMIRATVHEFSMADHVASWSSSYYADTGLENDRIIQDIEHSPIKESIYGQLFQLWEYDCERKCIFVLRRGYDDPRDVLLRFDLTSRKFIRCFDRDTKGIVEDCVVKTVPSYYTTQDILVEEKCDLDFQVRFLQDWYTVRRVCSKPVLKRGRGDDNDSWSYR